MESKQTPSESVAERIWRENVNELKRNYRTERRSLSFNEKWQIAFDLGVRDKQLKKAKLK